MEIIKNKDKLKLTNIEILIIRFVETKTSKFIQMSISEFADAIYVSLGAITHFVKKMGFENFKTFKKHVIQKWENRKKNDLYDPNDDIENVNLFYIHSIEKTINLLDVATIDKVVDKIIKAKKVITLGIGSSLVPANELTNILNSLNLNAITAKSTHDVVLWIDENFKNEHVVIIFSKRMSSHDLVVLYKLLKKHNIPIVLVTNNKKIPQEENVDILYFETLEQNQRLFSLSSKVSELFISDILLMKIRSKFNKNKGEFYKEFQKSVKKKI